MEAQNHAMAKAALAQAARIEAERRAEVEAPAKAEKARIIVEAEAEAEKRRIEAEGQAAATFARLDAEARGQYEILAKKGDGLKQIILACGGAQQAFQLMMLEHLDTLANTAAQAISNIKFDKVIVWEGGGSGANGDGKSNTANFLQGMARTLPPMMQVMRDAQRLDDSHRYGPRRSHDLDQRQTLLLVLCTLQRRRVPLDDGGAHRPGFPPHHA